MNASMSVRLEPLRSGSVVFASLADGRALRGRWTRHRIRYLGASWGFQKSMVTWRLYDGRHRLTLLGADPDDEGELILDESYDEQLIDERTPLTAEVRRRRIVVAYTLSGSNHFGSCVIKRELRIDLAHRTATVVEKSAWVDLND